MQLSRIMYVSSGVGRVTEEEIQKILGSARRNNAANDVSGMLLFCDGNFLQLLEGPPQAVEKTLERIASDARHKDINVLLRETADERSFANWSMGFDRVGPKNAAGSNSAFEISRNAIEGQMIGENSWQVRRMMETFYTINTRSPLNLTTAD